MQHSEPAPLDTVYAAPGSPPLDAVRASASEQAAKLRARASKLLLLSLAGFGVSIVAMAVTGSAGLGTFLFLGSALVALAGAGHSVAALTTVGAFGSVLKLSSEPLLVPEAFVAEILK